MHQVLATAGHVDHGKSSLILKLTGTDPDRFEEEKRRGLTIDLGFAWLRLPSGEEVGFVDVPGHERFIHNMLAGVGPVRLVLFVVAADEGWKPQSEEHLSILDLLGVDGAAVALTKCDLVDRDRLEATRADVHGRLQGTALHGAPIIACSARTGEGIEDLIAAIDALVVAAPASVDEHQRPRLFVDRVFTIKGAGTVVTGTLTGGRLGIGDQVMIYPEGGRARIRGMQSHERPVAVADPVSRVAVNLTGVQPQDVERGDMLGIPGQWRPTTVFEARLSPVRGLSHPLTSRGAFKLYAGSAERDAAIRLYAHSSGAGGGSFARIRLSHPVSLDAFDRVVIRESGRGETVAGGLVLDLAPPPRAGTDPTRRLAARLEATPDRSRLAALTITERGAVRADELAMLTGSESVATDWLVSNELRSAIIATITEALGEFHEQNPLKPGADIELVRSAAASRLARMRAPRDPSLIERLLAEAQEQGVVVRQGATLRLAGHSAATGSPELQRLIETVEAGGTTPPTIADLTAAGNARDLIDAACASGALVRISRDLVMSSSTVSHARATLQELPGITVSAFREAIGTTRKYAVPLLEYFDSQGVTLRRGDVRVLRT